MTSAVGVIPIASIVIPVRNCKAYIQEALDSVLTQSFRDFEVLIIDDGSDDFEYGKLQDIDPRIKVVQSDGKGVSHARNEGMMRAAGQFIAFLDADDVWFPGKLAAQIAYLEKHADVGVVFGSYIKWQQNPDGSFPPAAALMQDCTNLDQIDPARSGWLYTRLVMGQLVGMNTAIIRKAVYDRLGGFDESLHLGEDYDYWLKASRIVPMHALAGPVALYRIHDKSTTAQPQEENHLAALLRNARARWGLKNSDGTSISNQEFEKRIAETEFDFGYLQYWQGNHARARGAFAKALRHGYRPVRSLAYFILCCLAAKRSLTR